MWLLVARGVGAEYMAFVWAQRCRATGSHGRFVFSDVLSLYAVLEITWWVLMYECVCVYVCMHAYNTR